MCKSVKHFSVAIERILYFFKETCQCTCVNVPAPLSPIRTQSSAHDHAKSSANSWAPGPSGCFIGHQASFSETRKEGISVRIPPPLCQSVHIQVLYHCADYSADWFGLSMCLGGSSSVLSLFILMIFA